MAKFKFGSASINHLYGVHPDLIAVARLALAKSSVDFSVVDGLRTKAQQMENIEKGVSWTMNSRHLTGHAIDVYPWVDGATSHANEHYAEVARAFFEAAETLGVHLSWGGEWSESKRDNPHWELSREDYP